MDVTAPEEWMQNMWDRASEEFRDICGESLTRPGSEITSFEDVQRRIEDAGLAVAENDKLKWDKAKKVGLKSLKYLKVLVGVISQASAFTPIPAVAADVTSSALGFVFDIPQAIKDYNDAVDQVFSEISAVLAQFHIYSSMERIDPALSKQIHLVLTSFVKLCAHVVKYRQGSRRARLLRQLKSIFEEDSGLADEMTEFKRVLQQQRDVEGTFTLATVVETRGDVAILLEQFIVFGKTTEETHLVVQETQKNVQALKDDVDRIKILNKLRDTLGVSPTIPLDAKTTQTCTGIANQCLSGTGEWIWTQPDFIAWTASRSVKDKHSTVSPAHTLFLTGPPSSGKTSVAALIAKRLEAHKEEDRLYVAHYFFPPSTQKVDNAQTNVVLTALKHMAFQLARVDPTVCKALAKAVVDGKPDRFDSGLETLWRELKIGAPGSGAVHYLVFDGIEYLSDEQAEMLLKLVFGARLAGDTAGRVRVLLSGTNERFENSKVALVEGVLRVRMEDHNEPDMRIAVKHALHEHGMLQNAREGSAQQRAYDKIVPKLPKNVKGSYCAAIWSRSRAATVDHEVAIKNLQRSLTTEEIRELNELLKWVLFTKGTIRLDRLEAAMFLFSNTESLASLQYIIKHKYSAVLKVEDSYVYTQDGVKDYLEKDRDAANPSAESSTISMTIQINNVNQELCAHFLWDLAHKSIRDKFKFDFDGDMSSGLVSGGGRGVIAVDEFEGHCTIVQRAFHYLRNAPQEQTAQIGSYLVCWLPFHLQKIWELEDQDKGKLTAEMRTEIGQNLYLLFRDSEAFLRHKDSFQDTYWTADEMRGLQKWVMDSAVTRKLDARWRDVVQQATNPVRGFMKEFATVLVKGLLRERSWKADNACLWLRGFVEVDAGRGTVKDWEQVGAWCQKFLDLPDTLLDSLWYERLAEASSPAFNGPLGNLKVTRLIWQRAAEMKEPSWLCYRGLGLTYYTEKRLPEAITQVELALQKAGEEEALPPPGAGTIVDLHLLLGAYAYQSGDMQSAAQHYLHACESQDPEQVKKGQLGQLKAQLSILDAKERQEPLKRQLAAPGGEAQLTSILKSSGLRPRERSSDGELMQTIVQVLKVATPPLLNDHPRSEQAAEAHSVLLYGRGVAAYTYRVVANDSIKPDPVMEALRLWHACRDQTENRLDHFNELAKLAADPRAQQWSNNGDAVGFSGRTAPGAIRRTGESQERAASAPDNDSYGLSNLFKTLMQCNDSKNAGIALALLGPPDLVAEALRFDGQEVVDEAEKLAIEYHKSERMPGEDETMAYKRWVAPRAESLVDTVKRLAKETVQAVHSAVPDAAQQERRVEEAKAYVLNAQEVIATQNADEITVMAHGVLRSRLDGMRQNELLDIGRWWGRCEGRTADGARCPNTCDWQHDFYDCLYCTSREFCGDCLARLRYPDAESVKITWCKFPPQGDQFYVGLRASRVRVPEMRPIDGDEGIFEFRYAQGPEENFISVKDWKEGLAKEWGIEI
ncbi:hypothetical protein FB45DRAFT_1095358 [Roridomyces roridus]|uniref:Fungal STAND N-terminal Goodbye domain-containing protein n=1 Tax=Roridomyces roridus TaxID=1738132 RepID=A0AAD7FGS3_9AGAR|nr:hypothetical protein FB45DRAFT_1095358 [Roridomyces roridus]